MPFSKAIETFSSPNQLQEGGSPSKLKNSKLRVSNYEKIDKFNFELFSYLGRRSNSQVRSSERQVTMSEGSEMGHEGLSDDQMATAWVNVVHSQVSRMYRTN